MAIVQETVGPVPAVRLRKSIRIWVHFPLTYCVAVTTISEVPVVNMLKYIPGSAVQIMEVLVVPMLVGV